MRIELVVENFMHKCIISKNLKGYTDMNIKFMKPDKCFCDTDIDTFLNDSPTYSDGIDNLISDSGSILAVADTNCPEILQLTAKKLINSGKEFNIIFSTGAGESLSSSEKSEMLGEFYEQVKDNIIDHNPKKEEADSFFGITKFKTPIIINGVYMMHDTVITIGQLNFSSMEGYSAGAALIVPGISPVKTSARNRLLALPSKTGKAYNFKSQRFPAHDDSVNAVMLTRATKTFFAINVIKTAGKLIGITCGDLFASHAQAVIAYESFLNLEKEAEFGSILVKTDSTEKNELLGILEICASKLEEEGKLTLKADESVFDDLDARITESDLSTDFTPEKLLSFRLKMLLEKAGLECKADADEESFELIINA